MAGSNGSTTHKTEREPHTGITQRPRDSTEALLQTPSSPVRHSADAPSREGRISPVVEPNSSRDARALVQEIFRDRGETLFPGWTGEAVQHVISAAVAVPAAKACRAGEDLAVVAAVAAADSAVAVAVVAAVAAVAAAEGGSHA